MAKKRSTRSGRRRRSRRRGTGSVIRVRRLSGRGLGKLSNPNSLGGAMLPVLIGGGVTTLVAIGVQQYVQPTSETNMALRDNAPWVGVAAGLVTGLAMYNMTGAPQGVSTMTASALVGLALWGVNYAAAMRMQSMAAGTAGLRGRGMGAIVPEYSGPPRRRGTGAIVMEPQASRGYGAGALGRGGRLGSYGETVNLGNLGNINPNTFGTTGFSLGYGSRSRY